MSYHVRNSSHVTDHLLHMLRFLRYMCCVACCWKLCLTPAVRVLEGAAASCRRLAVHPAFQNTVTDNIRSYIRRSTCGSYRIVSYRDILCDIVLYLSFFLMAVSCHHYRYLKTMNRLKILHIETVDIH